MLVTPQMMREVDEALKKSQVELVQLSKDMDGHIARAPRGRELLQVSLKLGDFDLMIKRALNGRRF